MPDEKSPGFWFAEQSDGGRVGRQSIGWVRVHVDSTARLPIVVKRSGHDEIRSTEKKAATASASTAVTKKAQSAAAPRTRTQRHESKRYGWKKK